MEYKDEKGEGKVHEEMGVSVVFNSGEEGDEDEDGRGGIDEDGSEADKDEVIEIAESSSEDESDDRVRGRSHRSGR